MSTQQSIKTYFNLLNVLFIALLAGQIIFGIIVFVLHQQKIIAVADNADFSILIYIAPGIALICYAASYFINGTRLTQIKTKESIHEKLNDYRATYITRLALIEVPSFLGSFCFLLTGNVFFYSITLCSVVLFAMHFPGKEKLKNELELNQKERAIIDNPDETVLITGSRYEE